MNLPFRNKGGPENLPVMPEMNAPVPMQPSSGPGILWWRVAILALGVVAVVILLFFAGRWAVHKTSHKSSKPSVSTGSSNNKSAKSKSTSTPTQTPSSSTQNGAGTATPHPATSSTTPTSSTNSGTATSLTNTGPRETAAVFLVATASGVIGYQVLLRRRIE